jgi:uncharacterized membrane protein
MAEDNITATAVRFIKHLGVKISKNAIKYELDSHENKASLAALSDVLNKFNIKNGAYRIGIEDFAQLPCPFIVYLSEYEGQFGFITEVTPEEVTLIKEDQKPQNVTLTDFQHRYVGIVLLAEVEGDAVDHKPFTVRLKQFLGQYRQSLLGIGLMFVLGSLMTLIRSSYDFHTISSVIISVLKVAGVIVSVLLLNQSFGRSSRTVEKWCAQSSTDCSTVLGSAGSKILGGLISWAELGFFYFTGTCLVWLLLPQSVEVLNILFALNLICVCFSIYSIYYQYKVAHQWCLLCCAVLVIFYGEFFAFATATGYELRIAFSMRLELQLAGLMLAPVVGWLFFKPYFVDSEESQVVRQRLHRFERDKSMFDFLLKQQPTYPVLDHNFTISMGSMGHEHDENSITVISKPTCLPCAEAHKALEDLLEHRNDLQIRQIFLVPDDRDSESTRVASTLLSMHQDGLTEEFKQAQNAWYENMDYSVWSATYPARSSEETERLILQQRQWCLTHKINKTPTIIVNGHALPEVYTASMLQYLL